MKGLCRGPGRVDGRPAGSRLWPRQLLLLQQQVRRRGPAVQVVAAGILRQGWRVLWQRRRCLPLLTWQGWQLLCRLLVGCAGMVHLRQIKAIVAELTVHSASKNSAFAKNTPGQKGVEK